MGWFRRSGRPPGAARSAGGLPPVALSALGLHRRDAVLGVGVDSVTQGYAVFSRHHLSLVGADGTVAFCRPWHEVSTGGWEPVTGSISVIWADEGRAAMLTFGVGHDHLADVFRERVQASVVASQQVQLTDAEGPASAGQVAMRKDLATEELLIQVTLNRGVPGNDPQVRSAVERVRAYLWEQVGG